MVDLSIQFSASQPAHPASLKADTESTNAPASMAPLFDEMVGQLGQSLTRHERSDTALSIELEGKKHAFTYPSNVVSSREDLSRAFNADVAYEMLVALFKEKGEEFQMNSPDEIHHSKSGVTVKVSLSDYIKKGVFSMKAFMDSVLAKVESKNNVLSAAIEGFAPAIKLKGAYPDSFNLSLWFNDVLSLNTSDHPDLFSLEETLRRSLEGQR